MFVKQLKDELANQPEDAYIMIQLDPATYAEVYDLRTVTGKDDNGEYEVVLLCPYM